MRAAQYPALHGEAPYRRGAQPGRTSAEAGDAGAGQTPANYMVPRGTWKHSGSRVKGQAVIQWVRRGCPRF